METDRIRDRLEGCSLVRKRGEYLIYSEERYTLDFYIVPPAVPSDDLTQDDLDRFYQKVFDSPSAVELEYFKKAKEDWLRDFRAIHVYHPFGRWCWEGRVRDEELYDSPSLQPFETGPNIRGIVERSSFLTKRGEPSCLFDFAQCEELQRDVLVLTGG